MNPVEVNVSVEPNNQEFTISMNEMVSSGTDDYNKLKNHPSINGTELVGDKTTADLIPLDSDTLGINDNGELTVIGGVGKVTGVKGDAESDYRQGDINLTAENIGAYTKEEIDNKIKEPTVEEEKLKL